MRMFILFLAFSASTLNAAIDNRAAAQDIQVQVTQEPRQYVLDMLGMIADEGTGPLREFLKTAGYSNIQIDQSLNFLESSIDKDDKPTVKIIEVIDNAGILRQVYAYSHLGHNTWLFWRLDFVKTSGGWAMANFAFNSDYTQVLAPRFENNKLVE